MEGLTPGRIVHFFDPKLDGPRAAMIVRVWSTDSGTANLKVFLDCGDGIANDRRDWDERSKAPDRQGYYGTIGPDGLIWATSVQHKSKAGVDPKTYWDWPERNA